MRSKENYKSLKEDLEKKFEQISSLASYCEKPPKGWISSLREFLRLDQVQLARKAFLTRDQLLYFEQQDLKNELIPDELKKIGVALGGKFDYVFIPNSLNVFHQKISTKVSPEEKIVHKLKVLSSLPLRPQEGWIKFIRQAQHNKSLQIAEKPTIHSRTLQKIEKLEERNKFINKDLKIIANELGYDIEYFLIPIKKSLFNSSPVLRNLSKQLKPLSSIPSRPPQGWIHTIRIAQGLSASQIEKKLYIRQGKVLQLEKAEIENKFFPEFLNRTAQGIGCRFVYVFIPKSSLFDKKTIALFERFLLFLQTATTGYIKYFRKNHRVNRIVLMNALNTTFYDVVKLERTEKKGDIFTENVIKLANALECQLKYILVPENLKKESLKPHKADFWNEFIEVSRSTPQPTEGWFHYIRTSLGMTPLELAEKIKVRKDLILQVEEAEKNNKIIQEPFQQIARALECRFEYIVVPNSLKSTNTKNFLIPNSEFYKKLEMLSHLPSKPSSGWVYTMRKALKITRSNLCEKASISLHQLFKIEELEKKEGIFSSQLNKIAQALNCHLELIFLPGPNTLSKISDISKNKNKEDLKAILNQRFQQGNISFPEYSQISCLPKRPTKGWVFSLRKVRGWTYKEFSEKSGFSLAYISRISQVKIKEWPHQRKLQLLAETFGCQFDYFFIPDDLESWLSHVEKAPIDQEFLTKLKHLSLLPKKPAEGWIYYLREKYGLSKVKLRKSTDLLYQNILHLEHLEREDKIIPQSLKNAAKALGCRIEYFFIPKHLSIHYEPLPELDYVPRLIPPPIKNSLRSIPINFLSMLSKSPEEGWVYTLRKAQGLSQLSLAKIMGCSRDKIGKIERKERKNKAIPPSIKKLAHALGCDIDYTFVPNLSYGKHDTYTFEKIEIEKILKFTNALPSSPPGGWIHKMRSCLKMTQFEIAQKTSACIPQIYANEKTEGQGKHISETLQDFAKALGCRIERFFIPNKSFIQKFSLHYQALFSELESLSSYPTRPSEGWVREIRKSLEMSQLEFSKRIKKNKKQVAYYERQEINNKAIHPTLKKIAQALDCEVDYIFIPEKEFIAGVKLDSSNFLMSLKQLSSLKTPAKGWIHTIQQCRGISHAQLAEKANYSYSFVTKFRKAEAEGLFVPECMHLIGKALGGRFEYRLIPKTPLQEQELFNSLKKLSSSFYKPTEGWICAIRKIRGLSQSAIAKKIKNSPSHISYIEKNDARNSLVPQNIQNIADAMGGRFEYVLIPEDQIFINKPLQFSAIPQKPLEGWLKSLRIALGVSKIGLARMSQISVGYIATCEKIESQNEFSGSYFQKVAHALGGRFEYVIIPKPSLIEVFESQELTSTHDSYYEEEVLRESITSHQFFLL